MGETLTIRNFGPIKDMTFEFGKVNVLIGEQATGKSVVVKLIAVCRYFSYITDFDYFDDEEDSAFAWGLISWGLDEYVKKGTYIYYACSDYSIEGEAKVAENDPWANLPEAPEIFKVVVKLKPLSDRFKKLMDEVRTINEGRESFSFSSTPVNFFQNKVSLVMDNPVYLPVDRGLQSLFSLGKSSIQNLSDALFNQLAKIYGAAGRFKEETEIQPLKVYYKNVDGSGYVKKEGTDRYYSLKNAASGYQSAIPVVLMVKYYSQVRKKKKTFLIEEPELSLFPEAQQSLVNYLVESSNLQGNSIWLTTHSPYILTSLNNLIYAFEVGQKEPGEVGKIIGQKYWLNPAGVSAYRLLPNGTCESIVESDDSGTLISAEKIDEISVKLNKEFDRLIDVELSMADEKY